MKNFFKKIWEFIKKYWQYFLIGILTLIIIIFIFKSCDYEQNDLAKKILIETLKNENVKLKLENENLFFPISNYKNEIENLKTEVTNKNEKIKLLEIENESLKQEIFRNEERIKNEKTSIDNFIDYFSNYSFPAQTIR